MNRGPGCVVLYRWRVRAGREDSFIAAWSRITKRLRDQGGSFGSRLHRGADGIWYGYAQWPGDDARLAAFATPGDATDSDEMAAAIQERLPELLLESVADFLVLPVPGAPE